MRRPVAGSLGVLAGRGWRQPRPTALRGRQRSARGLAHVASASSGWILCGNCLLLGSSAENAARPRSTRHDERAPCLLAFKVERGGNGRGYRSPFPLRLPRHFLRSSCDCRSSLAFSPSLRLLLPRRGTDPPWRERVRGWVPPWMTRSSRSSAGTGSWG